MSNQLLPTVTTYSYFDDLKRSVLNGRVLRVEALYYVLLVLNDLTLVSLLK